MKSYIKDRYFKKFPDDTEEQYNEALAVYHSLPAFAPEGNIFEEGYQIDDRTHFVMRMSTQYYLVQAFNAMRIDLTNPNVKEDLSEGNIGTPGRLAKVWCGSGTDDDRELGGGRWSKKPRIATFPNTSKENFPITKRIDIISNCSHHMIPFSSLLRPDSYAVVSYIPKDKVLGISKLQRMASWVSQRYFLQEDLTKMLYEEISKVAETESVYVGLVNIVHGCEMLRGSKSNDGCFTSEYYGGDFKDAELRKQIKA